LGAYKENNNFSISINNGKITDSCATISISGRILDFRFFEIVCCGLLGDRLKIKKGMCRKKLRDGNTVSTYQSFRMQVNLYL
jgi:hypothetical protein